MSLKRKTVRRNERDIENTRPTRKSARLSNQRNDCLQAQSLIRSKREKFQKNVNTYSVFTCRTRSCGKLGHSKADTSTIVITNGTESSSDSDRTLVNAHINRYPVFTRRTRSSARLERSKPDTSTIVITDSTENSSDSGQTVVKTLKFSSSDSTASIRNTCGKLKKLSDSCDQGVQIHVDKKNRVKDGQSSGKVAEHAETSNSKILRSITNNKSYNLRERSRIVAEIKNEKSSSVKEEKMLVIKKNEVARKTKLKEKINENISKVSARLQTNKSKLQPLIRMAKSFPTREVQGKDKKKSKRKKTGTLARKRELRDMLEQQDEGYEDDAFEGTPFKNRMPVLKYKLSPVILETSIQSISTEDTGFKTPSSRTPVNHLRPAGPLSTGTSDEGDVMTPGLLNSVNRNYIDRYVNQLKRRKIRLGCCKKIKSHTPLSKSKASSDAMLQAKIFNFDANDSNDSSESEDDYYWSDS